MVDRFGRRGLSLPMLLFASAFFALLYAVFGYPAIVSEDPVLRYGMLALYLVILLSNASSYMMIGFGKEALLYTAAGLGGFVVGVLAAPVAYPMIREAMLLPIYAGRWLIGYIPTDVRANLIFYPLLTLIFTLYLVGVYSMANSFFISAMISTLKYPDLAFGIGLVLYTLANSMYLYMFATIVIYVAASVFMAYMYYTYYFIETVTSSIAMFVVFFLVWQYFPDLTKLMTTGMIDAFYGISTFEYTPEEWDRMMGRTVLIWLGTSIVGPLLATILGIGEYFGYYYETYRDLLVFVSMFIAAAGLSTAGTFAILLGTGRTTPRRISRIMRLAVPGIMYMSLCGMVAYDVAVDIVLISINDVASRIGPSVLRTALWFITGLG